QVALAKVPNHDPLYLRCWERERELITGIEPLPPLPEGLNWPPFRFRRGLPWHLGVNDFATLMREMPRLLGLMPLGALRISADHGIDTQALARAPWLARMERLEFNLGPLGRAHIEQLLASPHLARLRELAFYFEGIAADGLSALLAAPLVAGLRKLELGHNF